MLTRFSSITGLGLAAVSGGCSEDDVHPAARGQSKNSAADSGALLMLPTAEYDRMLVYAVSDSGVEERFSVQGFSYQLLEAR